MSTILNRMKKLKEQKNEKIIKDHPVANESIAIKMQYLNGLALMMNVDEDIADAEKGFFVALIEGFGLESSVIEDFISFAKDPDDEQIDELFEELSKTELTKFYFILDCYILAYKDQRITHEEKELIDMFVQMLNFDDEEKELFYTIRQQEYKNIYAKIGDYFSKILNNYYSEKEAIKWYKLAAEQGDAKAQNKIGEYYYYGNGVEKNFYEAVKWFKLAAENKDSSSQYYIGYCYYTGQGVEINFDEAVKWFKLAAEQGDADAHKMLGECYRYGYGVKTSFEEALRWYKLAAKLAYKNLGYKK
jgi:TPR repeat protein